MFAGDMAVTVEMHHTGHLATRAEIVALLEHLLGDRARGLAGFDRGISGQ